MFSSCPQEWPQQCWKWISAPYGCEVLSRRGGFSSKPMSKEKQGSLFYIYASLWTWVAMKKVCVLTETGKVCSRIKAVRSNLSSFAGSFFLVPFFMLIFLMKREWERKKKADQLWYFFGSRNHHIYPICREEAVRLLRSTRMARAYSEGAYTSDYDYERYWHALLLHPCIRHFVVSSSRPLSVFNLSVIFHVMTENDILSDISFCKVVITALKFLKWTNNA